MNHRLSADDQEFRRAFEACETPPGDFDHGAHVRLAYIYLCEHPDDLATRRMKTALLAFLAHLGIGEARYHETLTRAWILAVGHFMDHSASCASASSFIAANPQLLDSRIMLTHYSAAVLFSPEARHAFVHPDIEPIPGQGNRNAG